MADYWKPSSKDLIHLLQTFKHHSHLHLGQWSFWNNHSALSLSICGRTGQAYVHSMSGNRMEWVTEDYAEGMGWKAK